VRIGEGPRIPDDGKEVKRDAEYAEIRSIDQGAEVTGSDVLKVLAESGATYPQGDSPIGAADVLPMREGDRDGDAHILKGVRENEQSP